MVAGRNRGSLLVVGKDGRVVSGDCAGATAADRRKSTSKN